MKKSRRGISLFLFLMIGYGGLSIYSIANQNIEELLLCADSGGLKVPFSKSLCRQYLFAFRGTAEDIQNLHEGIGAEFVVQGRSGVSAREELLQFLITKGLDVNRISPVHGLTPLHAAVVANSSEEMQLLLNNGADTHLRDKRYGLTPLELAEQFQSKTTSPVDRHEIISLLRNGQ